MPGEADAGVVDYPFVYRGRDQYLKFAVAATQDGPVQSGQYVRRIAGIEYAATDVGRQAYCFKADMAGPRGLLWLIGRELDVAGQLGGAARHVGDCAGQLGGAPRHDAPSRVMRAFAGVLLLALVGAPLAGQQQDTLPPPPAAGGCVLIWEPLSPATTSLSVRDTPETHLSYISGRMLWTCGTATMEADSAVNHERAGRVDLIGNVVYRDTIRTLDSGFLTYFKARDLVISREDVVLVRTTDNSRLEGDHVEFLRAVSGVDELTTATGRPHMTLYPGGDNPGPPFEIDADRTVFAGEEEARAYGDVVVTREDLNGEADSAYMRRADEVGILWGDPWVDAQGVRLEGDTIRFRSEANELRQVRALGSGHAIGESFDVRAQRIDVSIEDEQPERVWAYGEGLSRAISGAHDLYGDSLEFAMYAGSIDTVYAIGEAVAIQGEVPADTLGALATTDTVAAPATADTVAAPVPADSTASAETEPAVHRGPHLRVDGAQNWIRGDTLLAIFERPGEQTAPDSLGILSDTPAGGADARKPVNGATLAESALGGAASVPEPVEADSSSDPLMKRLVAIGKASSFYNQVRDSTKTDRPSRNYMIGRRIEILFEEGDPSEVLGVDAIGVFIEPDEAVGELAPSVPEPAAGRVPLDSIRVRRDTTRASGGDGLVVKKRRRGARGDGAGRSR